MKYRLSLKTTSLVVAVWLAAGSLFSLAAEPESKMAAKLPGWADGWRVSGVFRQGSRTEASVEHRLGWKRFVREGDEWSPGVMVGQIDGKQRTVTLRRGEQTVVLRASAAPDIAKKAGDKAGAGAGADAAKTSFRTSLRLRLKNGETVVAGGWASEPGRRAFALGTPAIDAQKGEVTFSMRFIDAPETVWNRLGLNDVSSDSQDSSQSSTLAAGRLDAILRALRTEAGVDMLGAPTVVTRDGHPAQISMGREGDPDGMISVSLTPTLTPDRSAVDLSLDARLPAPPKARAEPAR